MIKSKLHNPIIAKNSHIENAVVERVTLVDEQVFSDLSNVSPIVPETGRIWYNTESGTFKFANIGNGGDEKNYVDEFLSRTDLRHQTVAGKVDFADTIKVKNRTNNGSIFTVDSTLQDVIITGANTLTELTGNSVLKVAGKLDARIDTIATVYDSADNKKIIADHTTNSITFNYANFKLNGVSETITLSDKLVINDGVSDKVIFDNANDKISYFYETQEYTATDLTFNVSHIAKLTDGLNDKIIADNSTNNLTVNYASTTINGNATVEGNMLITGDLTVGGQTTRVDISAETMTIADNVIVLNSNLDNTVDPRLASAIVDGTDVDSDAGIAVNRGSQGVLDLIKWVESNDTTTLETLKAGVAKVSIWNYEAAVPSYELHQIIDEYTLSRSAKDASGSRLVGYDGHEGINYTNAITAGATPTDALEYSFKVDAGAVDTTIDTIVDEIDAIKFNDKNTVRVGETPSTGTLFTITHNLGTVFVDVRIQREEDGKWFFDVLPIQVVNENTIIVQASETTKIRYMISAIQGFDINQATDLLIA